MLSKTDFKFPVILDNTIVSTWQTCESKAFLGHFLHMKPRGPQVHLDAGKVFAKALEDYRVAYFGTDSPTRHDHEACLLIGLRSMLDSWGYDPEVDKVFDTTKKAFHRVAELFVRYFTHFGHATDNVKPAMINGETMVEKSFTIPLELSNPDTGEPILYHGRYDMLADYHGGLFVYDDKTCSQLGKTWSEQWDFRSQFTGYCYGARANGYPVVGAIVRGSCFYANDVGFAESITYRKPWELDKWYDDVHIAVYDMIQRYNILRDKLASFPEGKPLINLLHDVPQRGIFSGACNDYAGCEYQILCKSQTPARWQNEYAIRIWDPRNPNKDE
jgi:hypothetical protein